MAESKETKIEVTEENEMDLVKGLLKAADYKNDIHQTIKIERNDTVLFKFKIRPLSFDEVNNCRKAATTFIPNPNGPKLPKIAKDVDTEEQLAQSIYTATVPESDGSKIWDNQEVKEALKKQGHLIMTGPDVVKAVLTVGELVAVDNAIDEISGNNADVVDYAKN